MTGALFAAALGPRLLAGLLLLAAATTAMAAHGAAHAFAVTGFTCPCCGHPATHPDTPCGWCDDEGEGA